MVHHSGEEVLKPFQRSLKQPLTSKAQNVGALKAERAPCPGPLQSSVPCSLVQCLVAAPFGVQAAPGSAYAVVLKGASYKLWW